MPPSVCPVEAGGPDEFPGYDNRAWTVGESSIRRAVKISQRGYGRRPLKIDLVPIRPIL
jgi:hypothetical protein